MAMEMSQNQIQQSLLAYLAGETDAVEPLSGLLEQSLEGNPIAAQVIAALRRGQEAIEEPPVDELADPEIADVLNRLYTEVEDLRRRTRTLSHALGACPRCWGDDRSCLRCRGRGRPGGRAPDAHLFDAYVVPAVRRHHRATTKAETAIDDGDLGAALNYAEASSGSE